MTSDATGTRDQRATGPQHDGPGQGDPHPARWRILGVTLVVGFMSLLDVSIVNVAVPSMQQGLHTSPGTIQWVVSGYALTFGLTLVAGGRLGDAYGRRTMMLIGLGLFVLTSALVGVAPTAELVVAARLLQGASAGLLTPQNSGLIQQLFTGAERGKAFGAFGFTVSFASAIGPVLGGLILAVAGEETGWRYLFLVNVPIGLAGLVAVARMVPKRPRESRATVRIDLWGAVLLGLTVFCLLLPVVSAEGGSKGPLLLLVLVPVLAWAFVRWERHVVARDRAPLLDLGLLRRLAGFQSGLLVGGLYFVGFTGVLLVLSVWFQEGLGYSPLEAGLLLVPFAGGSAVSAAVAGRFVTTIGRRLTVAALATIMLGAAAAAWLLPMADPARLWVVAMPTLLVAGIGGGAVVSPNITLTLADVPPRMGGAVGGALQTGQRVGAAIGAAVLMAVYQAVAHRVSPGAGLRAALLTGVALLALSLVMAVRALRTQGEQAQQTGQDGESRQDDGEHAQHLG
ncbi:MFS transporter [Lapillicoccus jejuensis]|uniref:EmrB/QacA subfamily drug resistance transporter n=1 Tax=Lapillicoccus jejuensis TaxID=402171 RepID=A0A542E4R3_9MICO|nr:MFS transporter [Lapillicoccus jejuensis]TQJ10254.1 EmrB/QacA subfamily drug resistance transporter [Lapillicoccus jejuensis]